MSSEARRLKEQLSAVGAAKAVSRRDDVEAHLSLPPGVRLERAARLSDALLRLRAATGHAVDTDAEVVMWRRVYARLHGRDRHG